MKMEEDSYTTCPTGDTNSDPFGLYGLSVGDKLKKIINDLTVELDNAHIEIVQLKKVIVELKNVV